ncbi:hypothetical protein H2248_004589 [Termitomyces sp. 'cryptogamus']|nr:hypothetical protein H2248_004589 [Termitomyces sp. 'cryptogamus']
MSAYGPINRAVSEGKPLPTKLWAIDSTLTQPNYVTTHHLTISSALRLEGLLDYLCAIFAQEVDDGFTYPQEGPIDRATFDGYFFAADVIVAIVGEIGQREGKEGDIETDIATVQGLRPWHECIAGFYYIKPNYPGRSSHICNAGFVVPPAQRSKGYGSILAKSFVKYAPALGYQGSVFNLVYANNHASIKLWERLNFTKAGIIPRAGRLKRRDGQGEEYVDAIIYYKSFVDECRVLSAEL